MPAVTSSPEFGSAVLVMLPACTIKHIRNRKPKRKFLVIASSYRMEFMNFSTKWRISRTLKINLKQTRPAILGQTSMLAFGASFKTFSDSSKLKRKKKIIWLGILPMLFKEWEDKSQRSPSSHFLIVKSSMMKK